MAGATASRCPTRLGDSSSNLEHEKQRVCSLSRSRRCDAACASDLRGCVRLWLVYLYTFLSRNDTFAEMSWRIVAYLRDTDSDEAVTPTITLHLLLAVVP